MSFRRHRVWFCSDSFRYLPSDSSRLSAFYLQLSAFTWRLLSLFLSDTVAVFDRHKHKSTCYRTAIKVVYLVWHLALGCAHLANAVSYKDVIFLRRTNGLRLTVACCPHANKAFYSATHHQPSYYVFNRFHFYSIGYKQKQY